MTAHLIEQARSGRSTCKTCKVAIAKDVLRLGFASPQENGSFSHSWYHLACAASDRPEALEEALLATTLAIPDRKALEVSMGATLAARPARTFPYAARVVDAGSCDHCQSWSFPNMLWVKTASQCAVGGVTLDRERLLHPSCAKAALGDVLATIVANSTLTAEERSWLDDDFQRP